MARVALVDDHPLYLEAAASALAAEGFDVVGSCARGDEVLDLVRERTPDIVLLDLNIPGVDGLACLSALVEDFPDVKVVVLSGTDDAGTVSRALELGAVAFVTKTAAGQDLAHAVRQVLGPTPSVYYRPPGDVPDRPAQPGPDAPAHDLTRRELEILALAVEGHSNAELAAMLWVTEQTVKFHLSNIYRKLDVANRTQASVKARRLGLVNDHRASA